MIAEENFQHKAKAIIISNSTPSQTFTEWMTATEQLAADKYP
jgi:hypothetical protein